MEMDILLFGDHEFHIRACGTAYQLRLRSSISSMGMERSSPYENFEKIGDAKDFGLKHNDNDRDRPTTANSQCVYDSCEVMRTTAQKFYLHNLDIGRLLNNQY